MDASIRFAEKLTGESSLSLEQAMQAAVGYANARYERISQNYDIAEVRVQVAGQRIISWQVTLKPKASGGISYTMVQYEQGVDRRPRRIDLPAAGPPIPV